MIVVVDVVLRPAFLGRPSQITDTALELEVVQGIHMVITRFLTVEPTRTGIALKRRAAMPSGVAMLVSCLPASREGPVAGTTFVIVHLEGRVADKKGP